MDLAEKVSLLREERKWTLAHVSKLTGISLSHISAIENGSRKNPSFEVIVKLARAYDMPLSYFIDEQKVTMPKDHLDKNAPTHPSQESLYLDEATTKFLASEDAQKYVSFARQLAERKALEDTSTLLQWIAEFLSDSKSTYDAKHK